MTGALRAENGRLSGHPKPTRIAPAQRISYKVAGSLIMRILPETACTRSSAG